MGFNIAGLVISQNYDKDIEKLAADLKWGIEIIEEVNFETASANWTPEGEFRLHFTDKATMIFFPHDWVAERYKSISTDTLNYAYSATAMAFQVDLFRSGKLVRSMFEHEGDRRYAEGEPLELEKENPTADGLTFALIDELLDDGFDTIDLSAKSFRCKKIMFKQLVKEEKERIEKEPIDFEAFKQRIIDGRAKKKKWWQFWK